MLLKRLKKNCKKKALLIRLICEEKPNIKRGFFCTLNDESEGLTCV